MKDKNTPDADTLSFCPVFYNLHSLSLNIRLEKFFSSFLTWNKFLSISQRMDLLTTPPVKVRNEVKGAQQTRLYFNFYISSQRCKGS